MIVTAKMIMTKIEEGEILYKNGPESFSVGSTIGELRELNETTLA